MVTEHIYVMG